MPDQNIEIDLEHVYDLHLTLVDDPQLRRFVECLEKFEIEVEKIIVEPDATPKPIYAVEFSALGQTLKYAVDYFNLVDRIARNFQVRTLGE